MGRLKELRKYVDEELNKMEDADKRTSAIAHLYDVITVCYDDYKEAGIQGCGRSDNLLTLV